MDRDKYGIPIPEDLRCMDCGKKITHKREAPSGSFLSRCKNCNAKRWANYQKQCDDPHSAVGKYPDFNWDDPWGY